MTHGSAAIHGPYGHSDRVSRAKSSRRAVNLRSWFDRPWFSFVSPLLLLAVWWWVTSQNIVSGQVLVSPGQVFSAFQELFQTGDLQANLWVSLARLFTGFAFGASFGIAFGVLIALSRTAERYAGPLFQILRQLPTVALIPMLLLIFGVGETFKIFVVAKATFFVVALATFDGVRNIPSGYFDVARLYKLPVWVKFRALLVPATVPAVLTGIRIGLGRSWLMLVAAELLAAESGIGQMMESARQMFRIDVVMVGVLLTGVIGFVLDRGLKLLEFWLLRWKRA